MNAPEQLFELVDVVRVQPEGGYRLALAFSDGTEDERDFADMVAEGGEMVEPLRDPAFFNRRWHPNLAERLRSRLDRLARGHERARPVTPHRSLSQRSARPQGGERVELRLFARFFGATIAILIAFVQKLGSLEFLGAFLKRDLGFAKLRRKFID